MASSSSPTLESSLPDPGQDAAAASATAQSASDSISTTPLLPNELKREILRFCDPSTLVVTSLVSLAFLELSTPILHDEIEIFGMTHLEKLFCPRDGPTSPAVDACLSLKHVRAFSLHGRGSMYPSISKDRLGGRRSLPVGFLRLLVHRPKPNKEEWAIDGGVSWSRLLPLFDPLEAHAAAESLEPESDVGSDSDDASDPGGDADSFVSYGDRGPRYGGGCSTCGYGGGPIPWDDGRVPYLNFAATSWSRLRSLNLAGVKPLSALGSADFAARGPDLTSFQPLEIIYSLYEDEDPNLPSEMFKGMWNDLEAYSPEDDLFGPNKRPIRLVICVGYDYDVDQIKKVFKALLLRYRRVGVPSQVKRLEDIIARIEYEADEDNLSDDDLGASEAARDDNPSVVDAAQTRLAALEV